MLFTQRSILFKEREKRRWRENGRREERENEGVTVRKERGRMRGERERVCGLQVSSGTYSPPVSGTVCHISALVCCGFLVTLYTGNNCFISSRYNTGFFQQTDVRGAARTCAPPRPGRECTYDDVALIRNRPDQSLSSSAVA